MRLGEQSLSDFADRLAGPGITFGSGPFVIQLKVSVPEIAAPIHLLYRDFPLLSDDFVDYHVAIRSTGRRLPWTQPSYQFTRDSTSPFSPFDHYMSLVMLEWGLNWCFYGQADQFLNIHAAVVAREDQALILPGQPGAGKSTLCAALAHRGWRLLSDELALIRPGDDKLLPIVRPLSLKNQSIELIRAFAPEAVLGPETDNTAKGRIALVRPPQDSVLQAQVPARPAWIVFPRYVAAAPAELVPATKTRSFFRLAANSFNYQILGETAFRETCKLVDACPCFDFTYSNLDEAVAIFDHLPSPRKAAGAL
jgi:HprK-related kinase A